MWSGVQMEKILVFQNQNEENLYLIMDKECFLDIKGGQDKKSEVNKIELYFKVKNFLSKAKGTDKK